MVFGGLFCRRVNIDYVREITLNVTQYNNIYWQGSAKILSIVYRAGIMNKYKIFIGIIILVFLSEINGNSLNIKTFQL